MISAELTQAPINTGKFAMITPGQVWRERRRNRFVRVMTIYDPAIIVVRGCDEQGQISIPTHRSRIKRDRFEHEFFLHRDRQPGPTDGYWWAFVKERDEPCVIIIDDGFAREVCQEVNLRPEQYQLMLKIDPPPAIWGMK